MPYRETNPIGSLEPDRGSGGEERSVVSLDKTCSQVFTTRLVNPLNLRGGDSVVGKPRVN